MMCQVDSLTSEIVFILPAGLGSDFRFHFFSSLDAIQNDLPYFNLNL